MTTQVDLGQVRVAADELDYNDLNHKPLIYKEQSPNKLVESPLQYNLVPSGPIMDWIRARNTLQNGLTVFQTPFYIMIEGVDANDSTKEINYIRKVVEAQYLASDYILRVSNTANNIDLDTDFKPLENSPAAADVLEFHSNFTTIDFSFPTAGLTVRPKTISIVEPISRYIANDDAQEYALWDKIDRPQNITTNDYLESKLKAELTKVYKIKGSTLFRNLPAPVYDTQGFVFNVSEEFTTTDSFVEGAGKTYPAGSNVVVVDIAPASSMQRDYKWDVLGGWLDLSELHAYDKLDKDGNNAADVFTISAPCINLLSEDPDNQYWGGNMVLSAKGAIAIESDAGVYISNVGDPSAGTDAVNKNYVDTAIANAGGGNTPQAAENTTGTIKLNPAQGITLNDSGQLAVSGRLGTMPGSTGIYASSDREPRAVGDSSFLITDAKGVELNTGRAFALVSGYNMNCKNAAPGTTEYRVSNTYANRILCKIAENGYASRDEATSKVETVIPVVSVTIGGDPYTPSSAANNSTNDIIIKTETTLNPDTTIKSIRIVPVMKSYSTAHIGNGIASWGGGRNFLLGGAITKDGSSNDDIVVGNGTYCSGNGNAVFGRYHIIRKNRGLIAGTGHDTTNAAGEGVSALGVYSKIDNRTLLAIGNGSDQVKRSNAFEVVSDNGRAGIVLPGGNGNYYMIYIDDTGALQTALYN